MFTYIGYTPLYEAVDVVAGQDLRLDGDVVSGCALLHGCVIHLTAFPFETQRRGREHRREA